MREKYINVMNAHAQAVIERGSADFAEKLEEIVTILNLEEEMLASYCVVADLQGKVYKEFAQMAIRIINKNLEYIYAAFILTQRGQYAAARVIFRNIYESLIILKTVSITDDQKLLNDWLDGKCINMRKRIFEKITSPKSEEMRVLWDDLCKFCHGTVVSGQWSYDYNEIKRSLTYNYIVLEMLLYMNYHALNRYVFTDGMKAMADRNIIILDDISLKERRDILRSKLKESKNSLSKEAQKVLTDFSRVWKFS